MEKILHDILAKRQLDVKDLTEDEKRDFDRWNAILNDKDVTVKHISEFCENQKAIIEKQWADTNNPTQLNERLIIYHTVYSKIQKLISSSKSERESLIKHLNSMLDS